MHMYMPAQIQLRMVKMVEIEPESAVHAPARPGPQPPGQRLQRLPVEHDHADAEHQNNNGSDRTGTDRAAVVVGLTAGAAVAIVRP